MMMSATTTRHSTSTTICGTRRSTTVTTTRTRSTSTLLTRGVKQLAQHLLLPLQPQVVTQRKRTLQRKRSQMNLRARKRKIAPKKKLTRMDVDVIDLRLMAVVVTQRTGLADTLLQQVTEEPQQPLIIHADATEMRLHQHTTVVPQWPRTPAATEGLTMGQEGSLRTTVARRPTVAQPRRPPAASLMTGTRLRQALASTGVRTSSKPRSSEELPAGRVIAESVLPSRLSHSSVAESRPLQLRHHRHLRDTVASALKREGDLRQMMKRCH